MFSLLLEELGQFLTVANATMKDINSFVLILTLAIFVILFSITSCVCRIIDSLSKAKDSISHSKMFSKERERIEAMYLSLAKEAFDKGMPDECLRLLESCNKGLNNIFETESGDINAKSSDDAEHQPGQEPVSR